MPMPEMPTLGRPEKKSPIGQVAIIAAITGTVTGLGYWVTHRQASAEPIVEPAVQAAPAEPAAAAAAPSAVGTANPENAMPPPVGPVMAKKGGMQTLHATLSGPLESAIINQTSKELGGPLTQVINRSLVWWLRVPNELVKGDTLTAVYEERAGQEPLVHAVRYTSRKFGKTFQAFRFKPSQATYPGFFQLDGTTLEEQLSDSPMDEYEQITSLLRDGRKHKGVDFKAPSGTPVKATFDGIVTRKTWHFRVNGNSLEVEESGGQHRSALFLHLSEIPASLKVGDRVKRGQVIAKSGNTGHSFAPHLHYQLMQGGKVLDPFQSHHAARETLAAADRAEFDSAVAKYKSLMPSETLASE